MHVAMVGLLLAACATDGGRVTPASESEPDRRSPIQVHLETGEGAPRTFTPPRRMPVEVTQAQFEATLARPGGQAGPPFSTPDRLTLISWGREGQEDERTAMTRGYHGWCERRGAPGDCLSLLGGGLYLGPEARRTLALSISLGSVWEGAGACGRAWWTRWPCNPW